MRARLWKSTFAAKWAAIEAQNSSFCRDCVFSCALGCLNLLWLATGG